MTDHDSRPGRVAAPMPTTRGDGHGSDDAADHRATAAMALYDLCRPDGALSWGSLTSGQQARYVHLVTMAARMTDVTALRAALEAGATGLATHAGLGLRDCTPQQRMGFRFDAMDCIRAFEDSLMFGNAEKDLRTLELQRAEQQAQIDRLHARAKTEDEAETRQRDARLDIQRYSVPASGHDGALFGDGRR